VNASTLLLQALFARDAYLDAFSRDELRRIIPILDAAHREVLGRIAETGGAWTKDWLAEIAAEIDAIYHAAQAKAYDEVAPDLTKLANDEGAWIAAETKQIAMGLTLSIPAPSLLSAVVNLPTNIGGSTLAQMFEGLGINARTDAYAAIQAGMLEGDTVGQMTRRLRGEVVKRASWKTEADGVRRYQPGVYKGGAWDMNTRQAETLARTAVMHVGNQARDVFYGQNQDIIKGYQRVETLDLRTCLICGTDDGHVYAPDDMRPSLPVHPDCRGVYVPVLKSWQELGFDAAEIPPGTRASMDGQVAEFDTWTDMVRKADPKRLEEMLGPGRAALYKQGVKLEDMVKGGEIVPIKDLAGRFHP